MPEPSAVPDRKRSRNVASLKALRPYVRRYRRELGLIALFLTLAAAGTMAIPAAVGQVIDQGFLAEDPATINRWFWLLFGAATLMAVAGGLRFYWVSWLGQRVVTDLRRDVYARVIGLDPEFFATTRTGEVLSRLNTDTTLVESLIGSSASVAVRNLLMLIGSAILLVVTAPSLAGVIGLMIVLVFLPVALLGRWVRRLSRTAQDRVADFSAHGDETINAVSTVQAFAQEKREAEAFARQVENAFEAQKKRIFATTVLIVLVIVLTFGAVTFVLWLGAHAVLDNRLTPGQLSQFVLYALLAAGSTASLSEVWGGVQRAAGAMERLAELLTAENRLPVAAQPAPFPHEPVGLAFDHVSFAYPSRPDEPVLHDLSFSVGAGETVALVGPSGAGKSTIFQLILRFYDPDSGAVRIVEPGARERGRDLRDYDPTDLRAGLGLVSQDIALFSGSAADNVRYGKPDAELEKVRHAARLAQASGFIEALPEGYDAFLGERGVRLSGGQRQRLAIARALIKTPSLLLLDEATASLDAESERLVQQAIEEASRERTVLVIAHRLATVRRADRILVIEQGELVAEGTHDELMRQSGLYQRLARLQFPDEVTEPRTADTI
ncbi:MAG: ABC transporter transmembrane domain-containing protein [Wenzhouxiangellaceae bacterium]|nr:ABC transporter transmembrane domain-containing protein [Wenzhouxiangellaceae bacterium]